MHSWKTTELFINLKKSKMTAIHFFLPLRETHPTDVAT